MWARERKSSRRVPVADFPLEVLKRLRAREVRPKRVRELAGKRRRGEVEFDERDSPFAGLQEPQERS